VKNNENRDLFYKTQSHAGVKIINNYDDIDRNWGQGDSGNQRVTTKSDQKRGTLTGNSKSLEDSIMRLNFPKSPPVGKSKTIGIQGDDSFNEGSVLGKKTKSDALGAATTQSVALSPDMASKSDKYHNSNFNSAASRKSVLKKVYRKETKNDADSSKQLIADESKAILEENQEHMPFSTTGLVPTDLEMRISRELEGRARPFYQTHTRQENSDSGSSQEMAKIQEIIPG
jgi:hypothetical protein